MVHLSVILAHFSIFPFSVIIQHRQTSGGAGQGKGAHTVNIHELVWEICEAACATDGEQSNLTDFICSNLWEKSACRLIPPQLSYGFPYVL